ncbi:hypothetical protein DFH06DRAFT_1068016 [Mycena polygramma]|nr:hypothetical protein DFH06DRAFT_1068016 [Mycena polygramma]
MVVCSNCGHNDVEQTSVAPSVHAVDGPSSTPLLRAQLDEVKSTIMRHTTCLKELRLAVLRQQAYLETLEEQRNDLMMQLVHVVYPVLTLPSDIVSRIFVACLPDYAHGRVRPSAGKPPLVLGHICRRWREIAVSSSELWTSVDLFFPYFKQREIWLWALPLLEMWLSRANGRLLSVTMRSPRARLPRPLISLLSSVAARLQILELDLDSNDFGRLVRACKDQGFPNLKRLAVSPFVLRNDSSLSAPSEPRRTISDSYPHLTTLDLGYSDIHAIFNIFQQFPGLLHLGATPRDEPSDQTLFAAHLRSLSLRGGNLSWFTLPSLRRLELHAGVGFEPAHDDPPMFPTLLSFLTRSSCVLEHLALDLRCRNERDGFIACLQVVPALTSLTINVGYDEYGFIQSLSSTRPVLPQLRTLKVCASYAKFDYFGFLRLLQLRRNDIGPLACLESARLSFEEYAFDLEVENDNWLPESVKEELERLVTQGLKLVVTFRGYCWPEGDKDVCETFPYVGVF